MQPTGRSKGTKDWGRARAPSAPQGAPLVRSVRLDGRLARAVEIGIWIEAEGLAEPDGHSGSRRPHLRGHGSGGS